MSMLLIIPIAAVCMIAGIVCFPYGTPGNAWRGAIFSTGLALIVSHVIFHS